MGFGFVVRDDNENFQVVANGNTLSSPNPQIDETISLCEVLTWIKVVGLSNVIFETDAKVMVDALPGCDIDLNFLGVVL